MERWARDGLPASPTAWLLTTARHRAIDRLRRERLHATKIHLLGPPAPAAEEADSARVIPDERLELIFMCCHPALAIEAQVALVLRALGGLTNEEIAARLPGLGRDHEAAPLRGPRPRSGWPASPSQSPPIAF